MICGYKNITSERAADLLTKSLLLTKSTENQEHYVNKLHQIVHVKRAWLTSSRVRCDVIHHYRDVRLEAATVTPTLNFCNKIGMRCHMANDFGLLQHE